MAAAATSQAANLRKTGIFWNNYVSDEEQPLAFVPGLSPRVSSLRRGRAESAVKSRKTSAKRTGRTASTGSAEEEQITMATGARLPQPQVCLKDLCPEDKKRIANLIQELARVSEEKEESTQRLLVEQSQFEQKILKLEEQNVLIAQERESLQQQYRECQELLGLYQLYLRQQQETITQQQTLTAQRPPHVATASGSLLDGSYLCLAPPPHRPRAQPLQPEALCPVPVPAPVPAPAPPLSSCHSCGCQSSERPHRPHSSGSQRSHRSESTSEELRRSSPREQRRSSPREQRRSSTEEQRKSSPEEQRRPSPPDDWEQKKKVLLLQKMQLEEERDRLQRRLSEQEQRRNRQPGLHSNGELGLTEEREDTELSRSSRRAMTKRDAGTSPLPSAEHQQHQSEETRSNPSPETRPEPSPEPRLDLSVSELLQLLSPVCASSKQKKQKSAATRSRAAPRAPPSFRSPARQDWEETQMLEEIFFIC